MSTVSNIAKTFLAAAGIVVAAGALMVAVPNAIQLIGQSGNIRSAEALQESGETYDCILVLGAGVRPDGSPSPMLKERLDAGIDLYRRGVAPKIVMSGDDMSDSSYDEVTNMKAYALAMGVPSEDVFCDHAGLCTYDSAYRAKYVFEVKSMVMVSQRYHLYRALFDAGSFGIDARGVAADQVNYPVKVWYNVREAAARLSDFLKVLTRQNATYLSEPVSLQQSGDVTTW